MPVAMYVPVGIKRGHVGCNRIDEFRRNLVAGKWHSSRRVVDQRMTDSGEVPFLLGGSGNDTSRDRGGCWVVRWLPWVGRGSVRDLLVLWDVDGTLLNAGGVGRDLYDVVFLQLFGRSLEAFAPMAGRTDRAIILDKVCRIRWFSNSGRHANPLQRLGKLGITHRPDGGLCDPPIISR